MDVDLLYRQILADLKNALFTLDENGKITFDLISFDNNSPTVEIDITDLHIATSDPEHLDRIIEIFQGLIKRCRITKLLDGGNKEAISKYLESGNVPDLVERT